MTAVENARDRLLAAALAYDAAQRTYRQARQRVDAVYQDSPERRQRGERLRLLTFEAHRATEMLESAATLYAMAVKREEG